VLEREQRVTLPKLRSAYSSAESIFPNLIIVSKGIDVVNKKSHSVGDWYEEECFVETMRRNQRLIGVGPHLLDEALGRCELSKESRPDTMLLSRNFRLLEMSEFKSGKNNGLHKKIEGFCSLLDRLRSDPELLPDLLNDVLIRNGVVDYDFPRIHIPENSEIIVRFASPFPRPPIIDGVFPFKVRFSVINREN
jgi:hypothetical protein